MIAPMMTQFLLLGGNKSNEGLPLLYSTNSYNEQEFNMKNFYTKNNPQKMNHSNDFNMLPYDDDIVREVKEGQLCLSQEGLGGTYLVGDENGYIAVYKPRDEEAGSHANPKKNFSPPRKGIKPGEGYIREVAAYLMDHEHFAGVPYTQFIEMDIFGKKKIGSLQSYVNNEGSLSDYGQSLFSVHDVHRIAQLDIRLFNVDRNEENLLVTIENGYYHLVPIDHAYSLPESLEDGTLFVWLNWKQTKAPIAEEVLEYIKNIDIERDEKILRMLNFSEESICVMKMSTLALKIGTSSGCTLYEIAHFLTKPTLKEMSPLELTVRDAVGQEDFEEHFWENFATLLEERIVRLDENS